MPSPGCIRSARPTAWTRSGIDPRTSAKYTESQFRVSTPSPNTFTELRNAFYHRAVPGDQGGELPEYAPAVQRLVIAAQPVRPHCRRVQLGIGGVQLRRDVRDPGREGFSLLDHVVEHERALEGFLG